MSAMPPDTFNVPTPFSSSTQLSVFQARADALAAANAQTANTIGRAQGSAAGSAPSAKITLQLTAASSPQSTVVRATSPGSPGTAPKSQTQSPKTPPPIASVVFDVSPSGGDGFAQSITDHSEANQAIHQTAGGFYVDVFGMKPGDFELDAIVVFTGTVATQVQVFKDLLFKSKQINAGVPVTAPPRLLYTNAVDGRTLLLTQVSLDVAQIAENPNQATISIHGSILVDYASASGMTMVNIPVPNLASPVPLPTILGANSTVAAGIAAQ